MKIKIILTYLFFLPNSFAEYRVFQYYVSSKEILPNSPKKYEIVTSILNPSAYKAYHGGRETLEINLIRTWICMGNTSHKEFCNLGSSSQFDEALK